MFKHEFAANELPIGGRQECWYCCQHPDYYGAILAEIERVTLK
ncbi:hypothetical protein [Desulfosporosinus sp. Sb-LF]|nr:hypothetical protein [Desulfosporosinus sp. Sb-LF]